MVANPERRASLADAGLQVLASAGARGLTHRAIDGAADVPQGTTANYFKTRDELLGALGERVFERLAPDVARLAQLEDRPPGIDLSIAYIEYIVERTTSEPDVMRALFELRLEASRRPGLASILHETLARNFRLDVEFNRQAGLAGGPMEIALLRYAVDGLLFELLTVPMDTGLEPATVVRELVRRVLNGQPTVP
ncbi:TetR/AcrR family transcriptional regulator [Antrihabitans cavernicola]|uniref:TetR family transcriptional regulator n=1 Tax=Antrihabitans cavernicola TaxID=2495913 RepID=A0A5A7S698_9NOCA|nr:TetR/AcrR family transcriptional regulator [Spelaeibacter cavernicola]KAA0019406.1 TetR family transcriptional regulator [Spelaeibacter cavernicola]